MASTLIGVEVVEAPHMRSRLAVRVRGDADR
jgi:hypothetical protein